MNHKDYIFLAINYDEPPIGIISGFKEKNDYISILDMELDNAGVPDDWKERLTQLKKGFYEIRYTSYEESESDGSGYTLFTYQAVGDLISIKKSFKARVKYYAERVADFFDIVKDLFRKVWTIEEQAHNFGFSHGPYYLWGSFFKKITFNSKNFKKGTYFTRIKKGFLYK